MKEIGFYFHHGNAHKIHVAAEAIFWPLNNWGAEPAVYFVACF
jgi:hypothetical protein